MKNLGLMEKKEFNICQIWWLAIRPKTLSAAISGVIAALAITYLYSETIKIIPALACMVIALLLQILSNLANDVFDFEKGIDDEKRIGPLRVSQAKLLSPLAIKAAILVLSLLTLILGIYLAAISSWYLLLIGVFAIISAIIYTGGPFPLGYYGFGDIMVFIFFGPVSVIGTFFIQTATINIPIIAIAIAIGLITTAILVVNNLRDFDNDKKAGKKTLAIRIGKKATRWQYSLCILIAFLMIPALIIIGNFPVITLSTTLAIFIATQPLKDVWQSDGAILNHSLAQTGKIALIYSVLLSASVMLYVIFAN